MDYFRLFFYNKKLLSFGLLLTFFSGFGKTFMITLYISDFITEFHLTTIQFSMLYALGTAAGGVSFIYLGKLIDRVNLQKYTLGVIAGLVTSCLLLAFTNNIFALLAGIIGLRLTGQGLMTHISFTAISKNFVRSRGRAISMVALGHPLGEAVLPFLVYSLIHLFSWRAAMAISSVFMILILIPTAFVLSKSGFKPVDLKVKHKPKGKLKKVTKTWTLTKILSNKKFYYIAPSMFTLAFLNTGMLFYLLPMAKEKGWSESFITHCLTAYGIGSFIAGIAAGNLADRYRASKIYPFYLLPYALGILLAINFSSPAVAVFYLLLTGLTVGMGNSMESTVISEVYGINSLGTVRSVYTSIIIINTAVAPLIIGILINHGIHFTQIMNIGFFMILVSSIIGIHRVYHQSFKKAFSKLISYLSFLS